MKQPPTPGFSLISSTLKFSKAERLCASAATPRLLLPSQQEKKGLLKWDLCVPNIASWYY
jgi:hypothetical protein